jgi:hypothetical protein
VAEALVELYRVEQCEYDYSPTVGIFSSFEKAKEHLKSLGAVADGPPHNSWSVPCKHAPGCACSSKETYAINKSRLDEPGEERI